MSRHWLEERYSNLCWLLELILQLPTNVYEVAEARLRSRLFGKKLLSMMTLILLCQAAKELFYLLHLRQSDLFKPDVNSKQRSRSEKNSTLSCVKVHSENYAFSLCVWFQGVNHPFLTNGIWPQWYFSITDMAPLVWPHWQRSIKFNSDRGRGPFNTPRWKLNIV